MKRPTGVVVSAVLLALGSLFQLLLALMMALSGAISPMHAAGGHPGASPTAPMPPWMPIFMYVLGALFVALAVWGIVTTVGLFRLRNWARYSVLVIGGGIALVGLISALTTLLLALIPMPLPPSADASQVPNIQAFVRIIFVISALFYAIVGGIGVYWLVYFNLKRVRAVFAGAAVGFVGAAGQLPGASVQLASAPAEFAVAVPEPAKTQRPFLISVLAVLNLIGAGGCLLMTLLPIPAMLLGVILHGWQKITVYLVFAALQAAVGIGLWRLNEAGRLLALAMTALGVAQCGIYVVRPSLFLRYSTQVNQMMGITQPQLPERFQTILYSGSFGFSVLLCIAIALVLIHYRDAFRRPIEGDPHHSAVSQ